MPYNIIVLDGSNTIDANISDSFNTLIRGNTISYVPSSGGACQFWRVGVPKNRFCKLDDGGTHAKALIIIGHAQKDTLGGLKTWKELEDFMSNAIKYTYFHYLKEVKSMYILGCRSQEEAPIPFREENGFIKDVAKTFPKSSGIVAHAPRESVWFGDGFKGDWGELNPRTREEIFKSYTE